MKIKNPYIRSFGSMAISIALGFTIYYGVKYLVQQPTSPDTELITIEATYMRYACGDWNDDMRVDTVYNSGYQNLISKDVDPYFKNDDGDVGDYADEYYTKGFGLKYRLKGHLIVKEDFGCDNDIPKFKVIEIECLDGSNKMTIDDFE